MITRARAAFVFIFITVLLDMVAFGVIIPVFPQLILQLQGGRQCDPAGARRDRGRSLGYNAPIASSSPSLLIAGLVTMKSTTPLTGALIVASGSPTRSVSSPTTSPLLTRSST